MSSSDTADDWGQDADADRRAALFSEEPPAGVEPATY